MNGKSEIQRNRSSKNILQLVLIGLLAASLNALFVFHNRDNLFDNTQYDVLLAQANLISSSDNDHSVAVIALDQKTLEYFSEYPRVMMAPKWAELIASLISADAKTIGFDIIFAYPDENFKDGWEQSFLASLAKHSNRIVFARSEHGMPRPRYQAAFRFQPSENYLGAVEVSADSDGIIRTMHGSIQPAEHGKENPAIPAFYHVIAKKAGITNIPKTVRLAPRNRLVTTPTYSMSDILACRHDERKEWLKRQFSGKIIVIGSTLKGEDDGITLDRFFRQKKLKPVTAQSETSYRQCAIKASPDDRLNTNRVPSVYLHAAALNQIIEDRLITVTHWSWRLLAAAFLGALVAIITMIYSGLVPLVITGGIVLLMHATSSVLVLGSIWYASAFSAVLLILTGLFTYVFKYLVVERKRRVIQTAFGLFLSDYLVDRLISEDRLPTLGGEKRQITVMFADLSGYTELSGKISPTQLMSTTNEYLEIMAAEIERSGGYIDKFIGDEIMAFWGAPADDPNHARHAIETSVRIIDLLEAKQNQDVKAGKPNFGIKIALNSGEAIIGNIGSRKRMNYSAVGQTINLAARFEEYASQSRKRLVIGENTYIAAGELSNCRFVAEVKIRGVEELQRIYSVDGFE